MRFWLLAAAISAATSATNLPGFTYRTFGGDELRFPLGDDVTNAQLARYVELSFRELQLLRGQAELGSVENAALHQPKSRSLLQTSFESRLSLAGEPAILELGNGSVALSVSSYSSTELVISADISVGRVKGDCSPCSLATNPWYLALENQIKAAGLVSALGSVGNPATSCSAILAADPTRPSGSYYFDLGTQLFQAYCDMTTDGGGWTLVMSTIDTNTWSGLQPIWYTSTYDVGCITPTNYGKSFAYARVAGNQVLFKTHNEAAGRWAMYDMGSSKTMLGLLGTSILFALSPGYTSTLAVRKVGANAVSCWANDWRVNFKSYYSADTSPDSSVFAPAWAAYTRPCGGSTSYSTGIGCMTDSNSNYGGTFEGYGREGSGNAAVTGGYLSIYVRTNFALAPLGAFGNPAASCLAILQAGTAGASGIYYLTGSVVGQYLSYCDFGTDVDPAGGGWSLVMSSVAAATKFAGNSAYWYSTAFDYAPTVTPTAYGKSLAFLQVQGTELLIRTHNEASGRWARFSMGSTKTMSSLLGSQQLSAYGTNTYSATLTSIAIGAAANPCFGVAWRVNWKSYATSDTLPDSSVFAPSTLTSSYRPCGGSTAWGTGIGVFTDNNANYASLAEGVSPDSGGAVGLTNGYVSMYIR